MSAITASDARKRLLGLTQQVNDDHTAVEVVSRPVSRSLAFDRNGWEDYVYTPPAGERQRDLH